MHTPIMITTPVSWMYPKCKCSIYDADKIKTQTTTIQYVDLRK